MVWVRRDTGMVSGVVPSSNHGAVRTLDVVAILEQLSPLGDNKVLRNMNQESGIEPDAYLDLTLDFVNLTEVRVYECNGGVRQQGVDEASVVFNRSQRSPHRGSAFVRPN